MSVVSTIAGALLVLGTLREVFHTLLHPSGHAQPTMSVFALVWRLSGRLGDRARSLSGPLAMVLVIVLWAMALVTGWALIYWPALPQDFILASPLAPRDEGGLLDALYFSWVTQATLGYGDIAPRGGTMRVLAPLQATIGFGFFTLVATWVLSVYPALHRQRAAATLAHALQRSYDSSSRRSSEGHPATLARQSERLSELVNSVRVDYIQYPSTFFFSAPERSLSLAAALPFIASLARGDRVPEQTREAAAELQASLDLLADTLGARHLGMPGASTDEVLAAYRRHHGLGAEQDA